MLSDPASRLAAVLRLPTFTAAGHARLAMAVRDGVIEHAFSPIFPPNRHEQQVLDWLRRRP